MSVRDAGALARWLLWPEREPAPESVAAAQNLPATDLAGVARAEGLAPLLHYRARKAGIVFSPALSSALSAEYHESLARNTYLLAELASVLGVAAAHGVDVLVLKGAHLATWLYPSPATRPMVDVDLLVRREQTQTLVALLCARDYQVVSREPRPGVGLEFENQVLLAHPGKSAYGCLALHWSLLDFPSYQQQLQMEELWQRAVPYGLQDVSTRVLGAEDLLVYLCAHLALHHQWSRLIWLCDIGLLLERVGAALDWERVCALAAQGGLSLAMAETLRRTAETLGTTVPSHVWSILRAAPVSRAELYAWRELTQGGRGAGRSFWANVRSMRGGRARLNFALAHLLPAPGYMRERYDLRSDWELPAAYARRWWLGIRSLRRAARSQNAPLRDSSLAR